MQPTYLLKNTFLIAINCFEILRQLLLLVPIFCLCSVETMQKKKTPKNMVVEPHLNLRLSLWFIWAPSEDANSPFNFFYYFKGGKGFLLPGSVT